MFHKVTELMMMNISTGAEYEQMGIKKGIRVCGEEGIAAVIKEYEQLRDTDTERAVDAKQLSDKQKREALELLTLKN